MNMTTFLTDLYNTLTDDDDLMDKIQDVYYEPPGEAQGPYIVIGSQQDLPGRLLDASERQLNQSLYIWSTGSRKELFEIRELLEEALKTIDINTLDGYEFYLEECQVLPADDDGWRQMVMDFRIYLT